MRVSGYERNDFVLRDSGEKITGFNVYISKPIATDRGRGQNTERIYLSDRKIQENSIKLEEMLNKDVIVGYNRYGKVQTITLV